jgi:hypothetical protein
VRLSKTLPVGDLEVTPRRVERRPVLIRTGSAKPEPGREDALALVLGLRNRSDDVAFRPLDPYFVRRYDPNNPAGEVMPYTILFMGDRKFYGGPIPWHGAHRETVEGQDLDRELLPGDEMETFICTDPDDGAVRALEGYKGPLTWRVQVRRGLVKWRTPKGLEREDPATAVVAVDFNAADVVRGAE